MDRANANIRRDQQQQAQRGAREGNSQSDLAAAGMTPRPLGQARDPANRPQVQRQTTPNPRSDNPPPTPPPGNGVAGSGVTVGPPIGVQQQRGAPGESTQNDRETARREAGSYRDDRPAGGPTTVLPGSPAPTPPPPASTQRVLDDQIRVTRGELRPAAPPPRRDAGAPADAGVPTDASVQPDGTAPPPAAARPVSDGGAPGG